MYLAIRFLALQCLISTLSPNLSGVVSKNRLLFSSTLMFAVGLSECMWTNVDVKQIDESDVNKLWKFMAYTNPYLWFITLYASDEQKTTISSRYFYYMTKKEKE